MKQKKIIEVKKLTLVQGQQKILDIDYFALKQGETIALIGPNGAGKSSFLQVLMLLRHPTSGEMFFKGQAVNWKKPIVYRRRMAMVFQEALLLDTSVYNNVASGLKIRGCKKERIPELVNKWLIMLDIEHLSGRLVRNLSGGEAQRVSLARALVMEPEVLFLDEPFSALDAPTRTALIAKMGSILRDSQISTVFVTHNYSEIPLLTDRVVALEKGKVIQEGSPREILNRPANKTVASLVGVENVIPARIIKKYDGKTFLRAGPCTIMTSETGFSEGEPVYIVLRPEYVKITVDNDQKADNVFDGTLRSLLPYGGFYKAEVDCGFPVSILLNSKQVLDGEVAEGSRVSLYLPPDSIHLTKWEA